MTMVKGWHYSSYEDVVVVFPDGSWVVTSAGILNNVPHVDKEIFEDQGLDSAEGSKIQRLDDVEIPEAIAQLTLSNMRTTQAKIRRAEKIFNIVGKYTIVNATLSQRQHIFKDMAKVFLERDE